MNNSLVTTKHISLPTELESLFGDVPLVGRERREDYDAFFSAIAAAEVPIDAIDWMLLRDLVDLAWEIRRERRIKVEIIKLTQTEVVCDLLKNTFDEANKLRSAVYRIFGASTEAHQWASDPDMRERINLKLEEKGHDQNSVLARAYLRGADEINAIDKRIAILESRRNKVLKEISLRNERKAQKLAKAASDIIEGEYSEATD